MEYVNLGRTGLKVSPLCLGTMNFGPITSEADSHTIMDAALERGLNFFDTADVYGWQRGEGITEKVLGTWFAKGEGRRDAVVLATKAYGPMGDGPNDRGLSARHLIAACEASLKRMQTDYIDLYQMHHVERSTPWEEIWQAMDLLVSQGKIRYVGSSNFAGWHLVAAQEAANRRNSLGLVSEQGLYNLMARTVELEVLPAAEAYGIGFLPWSPLNGGALSGALRKIAEGKAGRSATGPGNERVEENREQLAAWEKFCEEFGHDPADVGLAWLLTRPAVTAPIVGPRTIEQLDSTLGCLDVQLDDEQLDKLDELFPPVGKGGPGPEAWAW
ncbi:aldo/keto reductase [Stackebrandtia nassauensis]|uniref:Aldo/keto reductase n=1 Tax=Stackebrandtia nassauensis (strain DSM 44728 / CIP 108903 / NRRL B-16338 / NBRC 102104 / LLR-40K-21) TaxID=446470 RepID=D3PX95_STANL|nr:aldo/keto reductase [Stackebrandtia nassauensis]ADD41358.1 aldo/keto reductase [Stackebrandtia nassauensis DSM 44728]